MLAQWSKDWAFAARPEGSGFEFKYGCTCVLLKSPILGRNSCPVLPFFNGCLIKINP